MKLFASLLAVGILAAPSTFAQSYMSPGSNCRPGDLNCPTSLDAEAPLVTGRSATEVAPPNDPVFGLSAGSDDVISSHREVRRDGATGIGGYPPPGSGNSNR
jgi:hypothetical protein